MPCAGSIGLPKDKFFQWTALEDGDYWFDTRLAGFDSYVVVYDGSDCSAPCLAIANPQDHPYGQGKLLIPGVSAGAVLMIQVAADHPLLFSDDQDLAIYRDACSIPDSFEPNESIGQAAPIDSGIYLGLGVSSSTPDLDFYSFTLQPGEAIFASLENVEGGPAALHALDVAGAEIATSYSPDVPLFVNTFPWASTFYLRVDASPIWVCTRYDLHVAIVPDPCSYSGDDAQGDNDTCATAQTLVPGVHAGLFASILDPDYYSIVVGGGAELRVDFANMPDPAMGGMLLMLRANCSDTPVAYGDRNGLLWQNPAPTDVPMILEVRYPLPGPYANHCFFYDLYLSGSDTIGSSYCSPAVPNSTGLPGRIQAQGSSLASAGSLTLVASDLPSHQFGFFIGGRTQGLVMGPAGSQGDLCLGGAIARFNRQVGIVNGGYFQRSLDLTDIPEPPNFHTVVLVGETWHFQFWHRDWIGSSTSNFTDAVSVTFQ